MEPIGDERAEAGATIAGKTLVVYGEPYPNESEWALSRVVVQTDRWVEIWAEMHVLPPVRELRVSLADGEAEELNALGVGTNMGFMLVHRGRQENAWSPVTCGDAGETERPTNRGYTMFDDATVIDRRARTIAVRFKGPVPFADCGISEPEPIIAMMAFPWSNFGDMAGGYRGQFGLDTFGEPVDRLGIVCCGQPLTPIRGNGAPLYALTTDWSSGHGVLRLLHVDPETLVPFFSTETDLGETAFDLAMTQSGRLFAVSSRLTELSAYETGHARWHGDLAWWDQKLATSPVLGIGFGPDGAGSDRLLAIDAEGTIWDLLFDGWEIGTPRRIGNVPGVRRLATADIAWTAAKGWVVVGVESRPGPAGQQVLGQGFVALFGPDAGSFRTFQVPHEIVPTHLAAMPDGALVGQTTERLFVSLADSPWRPKLVRREVDSLDTLTSPWRP